MDLIFPNEPISYMRTEFKARRLRNPRYSVRAFARDLGLSPSHLSEFLSGKANLSCEKAPVLAEKLNLKGEHKQHWCDLLSVHSRIKSERDAAHVRILQRLESGQGSVLQQTFERIYDWHYFAILTYLEACPQLTVKDLSRRLKLPLAKTQKSIDTLLELKLLKQSDSGVVVTDDISMVGNTVPSAAIREFHRQILNKAIKALETVEMKDRENQSLFVCVPKERQAEFHEAMRAQILQLAAEFSQTQVSNEEAVVHAVTLQIFPV